MVDDGCTVEGYQSDITRTFVLGKATDKMKKVFDIVHQAQAAALKAARPGVPLEAIDAAGRKIVVDNGYGPGFKYFTHRLGHGMGMDGHEWPYLVKNNMFGWEKALTLQPGMVFSDEPGIYITKVNSVCVSRTTCTSPRTAPSCSRHKAPPSRSLLDRRAVVGLSRHSRCPSQSKSGDEAAADSPRGFLMTETETDD
jgi:methionine aminopeptidase